MPPKAHLFEFEGKQQTLVQLAAQIEMPVETLRARIKRLDGDVAAAMAEGHREYRISGDLTGRVFGQLTALHEDGRISDDKHVAWKVRCECGTEKRVAAGNLIHGGTKSCGCSRAAARPERRKRR